MKHQLLTYLSLLQILCFAQVQAKGNYNSVPTFLDAVGADSITDITYYDELGRESELIAVGGYVKEITLDFSESMHSIVTAYIKQFRAQLRGIIARKFFLFRLTRIYT